MKNYQGSSEEWLPTFPGEPRFGLLGRDPEAPAVVLHWARLRRDRLLKSYDITLPMTEDMQEELAQCTEAETIAWKMQAYQKGQLSHSPDESDQERAIRKSLETASARLFNMVAELNEISETFHDTDWMQEALVLRNRLDTLAKRIQPRTIARRNMEASPS